MVIEVVVDGIELDSGFLDELFLAIRDKLPNGKWAPITKDRDRVVAGVKYLIDCAMFGADFDVAFNEDYTHFKKIAAHVPPPNVYDGKQVSNYSYAYWSKQDDLELDNKKRTYERAQKHDQLIEYREKKKKRK